MPLTKFFFITLLIFSCMEATAQKTEWNVDKAHSNVSFTISHFMIATVRGAFNDFAGSISSDGEDFEDARLKLTIQSSSINTNDEKRDEHLRSEEFFGVEQNPKIIFESSDVEKLSDNRYKITGPLTMNGITKEVTLMADYKGSFEHPQYKKTIAVFDVTADIPRLAFNVGTNYPAAALGETVQLASTVELAKN